MPQTNSGGEGPTSGVGSPPVFHTPSVNMTIARVECDACGISPWAIDIAWYRFVCPAPVPPTNLVAASAVEAS